MTVWPWRFPVRLVVLAACLVVAAAAARPASASEATRRRGAIPFPAGLEEQVQFWKDVFTIYTTKHVVIHDRENVTRIYSVLDFTYLDDGSVSAVVADKLRRERIADEMDRVRAALIRIGQEGQSSPSLSPPEEQIARLFPPARREGLSARQPKRIACATKPGWRRSSARRSKSVTRTGQRWRRSSARRACPSN